MKVSIWQLLEVQLKVSPWREFGSSCHEHSRAQVETLVVTDSSSCRAFSHRMGVGRLKHVDTKYLWMQKLIKDELMGMDGVGTIMNVADLGAKRVTRARREFLMFLLNLVFFSNDTGKFEPVGKEEYESFRAKKAMASEMKEVRRVMLRTLADGSNWRPRVSTKMVKAIAILALQREVHGFLVSDIQNVITVAVVQSYEVPFFKVTMFLVYTMVVFLVGMWFGYLHWVHVRRMRRRVIEMQENGPAL